MKTNKRINILTTTKKRRMKCIYNIVTGIKSQYQSQSGWNEVKDGKESKRKKSKTLDYKFKCKKLNTHFIPSSEMFSQSFFSLSVSVFCLVFVVVALRVLYLPELKRHTHLYEVKKNIWMKRARKKKRPTTSNWDIVSQCVNSFGRWVRFFFRPFFFSFSLCSFWFALEWN